MKWYYKVQGGHTHVRVFMNGGKCGDLCFRNEEFLEVKAKTFGPVGHHAITFIDDDASSDGPDSLGADEILGKRHYNGLT